MSPIPDGIRSHRTTMADEVVARLRTAIVLGDLPPGSALRLEEVAQELDMSISPVREAIRQLEVMGLVQRAPYRGARVAPLTMVQMQEAYDARRALEGRMISRAAERFTDENVTRSQAFLYEIDLAYKAGDARAAVVANYRFHTSVIEPCGSDWLMRIVEPIFEVCERYSAALLRLRDSSRPEIQEIEASGHRQILAACAANDPDKAELALLDHLRVFEEISSDALKETGVSGNETPTTEESVVGGV